ncbi:MAG: PQQ-dependent sugar dehydrogenase [Oligoflexia bacterium]|nr:PQQ-dependent sugar dehydrogenase [Oligoflexia bacterium]
MELFIRINIKNNLLTFIVSLLLIAFFSIQIFISWSDICWSLSLDKETLKQKLLDQNLKKIKLPVGFKITLYAKAAGARSISLGPKGIVFVGTQKEGVVYAIVPKSDSKNDYSKADKVITIIKGLNTPNGVAYRNGSLYVAEINRILRFSNIEENIKHTSKYSNIQPTIINDSYPTDNMHGWKFIAFGPDSYLYVPVGAPCNICESTKDIYASITRIKESGKDLEIFASGVRNSVGFDWHPITKELWFTDNGRDLLGDNRPADELNWAPKKGLHFGYPYCHGDEFPDPQYGKTHSCKNFIAPQISLPAHVAALGMRFYVGKMFPAKYYNQIFIAEHGSWNRSVPIGYRISIAYISNNNNNEKNKKYRYEVFAKGWLNSRSYWGRPVDLQVMPDGSLLVSDDSAGAIYRISYQAKSIKHKVKHKVKNKVKNKIKNKIKNKE